jgi:hypothetical protein
LPAIIHHHVPAAWWFTSCGDMMDEVPGKRRRGGAGSPTAVKLEAFLGQRCSGACAREQLPDKTQWLLESILLDSCREIAKQCSS